MILEQLRTAAIAQAASLKVRPTSSPGTGENGSGQILVLQ
jgi:hypothetical protein